MLLFFLVSDLFFGNKTLSLKNKGVFIHYPVITGAKVLFLYDNFCYVQHTAIDNEVRWKCINYKVKKCKAFVVVDKQQLANAMIDRNKLLSIITVVEKDKYPHSHCASKLVIRF